MTLTAKTFASGFAFPEGPRWHNSQLWFSDMLLSRVFCLSADGQIVESFEVPGRGSGLGWLPGGDLLVVSMRECRLYRRTDGVLQPHAELRQFHHAFSNDMVVDGVGRAYIGAIGTDFENGEEFRSTSIAIVSPSGKASCGASNLHCPNGLVITGDGRTLIVAESEANRLSAFDIDSEGELSNYRCFADLGSYMPDGICLDAHGGVWVATTTPEVIRVEEGGKITDRVTVDNADAYACMLGGDDGRDLFICCAPGYDPVAGPENLAARIDVVRVPIPHAGLP